MEPAYLSTHSDSTLRIPLGRLQNSTLQTDALKNSGLLKAWPFSMPSFLRNLQNALGSSASTLVCCTLLGEALFKDSLSHCYSHDKDSPWGQGQWQIADVRARPKDRFDYSFEQSRAGLFKGDPVVPQGRQPSLAETQFSVSVFYEEGRPVAQSHSKALELYLKAVDQGFAVAQYYVGVFQEQGFIMTQSYSKAMGSFLKAARQGYTDTQFAVGEVKTERLTLQSHPRLPKSDGWYLKAAEQGHALSQPFVPSSPPWKITPPIIHGHEAVP
ncbi:MAG: hypothetical protein J3R72DRAFT_527231 [Linnemannia gamsii]|nr:MAG: hypothetical protein J3R72DRAFT_527231 [Linnemannia gamsii]